MSRPVPKFHDFIGHKAIVDRLRRLLSGAQTRKLPFPHTLLLGPSGVEKTRLARALAAEYGTQVVEAKRHSTRQDLFARFITLKPGDFLLIDECHRLGGLEQELLYEAIDQLGVPDLSPEAQKNRAECKRIELPIWSLILATDQPGKLLDALIKRVVIQVELRRYPIRELKEIVAAMASDEQINILLSSQGAGLLAKVADGLPRKARHLLERLHLHFPDSENRQLGLRDIRQFLHVEGIDRSLLNGLQRRYLKCLSRLEQASLESLALALGIDQAFLRREAEAPLVRRNLVTITAGGRRLTARGKQRLRRCKASGKRERGES